MTLKLIMAVFWLGLGAWVLIWPLINPDAPNWNILNTGISAGWLAILMGLFNLVRSWSEHSFRTAHADGEESALDRHRHERERRPRPFQEPDPTFDFSQPAPDERRDGDGTASG